MAGFYTSGAVVAIRPPVPVLIGTSSGDEVFDNVAVHVRESEVAACISEGQLLMVEAQKVKQCRVKVVNMNGLFHGLISKLVGGAVNVAPLHAAAREPHREAIGVMVSPGRFAGVARFRQFDHRSSPELAAPDHDRFVE